MVCLILFFLEAPLFFIGGSKFRMSAQVGFALSVRALDPASSVHAVDCHSRSRLGSYLDGGYNLCLAHDLRCCRRCLAVGSVSLVVERLAESLACTSNSTKSLQRLGLLYEQMLSLILGLSNLS